jgi:hypothetical protein
MILTPGADQNTPVLPRALALEWISCPVAGTRLSPASTSRTIRGPSPANLVDATGQGT